MAQLAYRIEHRPDSPPSFGRLILQCAHGMGGECSFSLGPVAQNSTWQWDGNVQQPTISPSIACLGGCGRHFTMIKGKPHG